MMVVMPGVTGLELLLWAGCYARPGEQGKTNSRAAKGRPGFPFDGPTKGGRAPGGETWHRWTGAGEARGFGADGH